MSKTQGMGEKTMRTLYRQFGEKVNVPGLTLSSGRRSFTTIMKSFCGASENTVAKATKHSTGSNVPRYNKPTKDYLGSPSRHLGEARKIAFCLKKMSDKSYSPVQQNQSVNWKAVAGRPPNESSSLVSSEKDETPPRKLFQRVPCQPSVIRSKNEMSPTKFRIFKEKSKSNGCSIDDVFRGFRRSTEMEYLKQPQPQPQPQQLFNPYLYHTVQQPHTAFPYMQHFPHTYQPQVVAPYTGVQYPFVHQISSPYFSTLHNFQQQNPMQVAAQVQETSRRGNFVDTPQKKNIYYQKKIKRVQKRKKTFISSSRGNSIKSKQMLRPIMDKVVKTEDPRQSKKQNAKLIFGKEQDEVCSPVVAVNIIPLLPISAIEVVFKKTVEKLKQYRASLKKGENQLSPKTDPRTTREIFETKTRLWRRLNTLRRELESGIGEVKDRVSSRSQVVAQRPDGDESSFKRENEYSEAAEVQSQFETIEEAYCGSLSGIN